MIPAQVHGTVPPGTIGLVKSAPCLTKRYHLQGATTLVKISQVNTIPFRLINPTTKPVTLYKGTTLGKQQKLVRTLMFNLLARKRSQRSCNQQQASIPVDLTNSNLTLYQQTQIQALLNEFRDIFALSPSKLGRTNLVQHGIDTEGHAPIRLHP